MRRFILCLLMLATVTVATAHEEHRWPAWLSAGQDDAVRSVANTQGAIPQATLLTSFGDYGKVAIADHLGSITRLVNASGTTVFGSTYDVWGKQSVGTTTVKLHRGYTGHEMLSEYGLINIRSAPWDASLAKNGRLYDPLLGRFLSPDRSAMPLGSSKNYVQQPDNSQNFNRYSYCLNNPLKYNDPSGELIWETVLTAVLDFTHNVFIHGVDFQNYNWSKTVKAWKIDMGMFKGNFGQIVNKWTWGRHNSLIGNAIGHTLNILGFVDGISDMEGMVAVGGVFKDGRAFTIGPYSFGPKGYKATWKDHLFVHEYGHYMQSQIIGPFFIPTIGVPSLASTLGIGGSDHSSRWFEVDASRRGAHYFDKRYGSGADGYIYKSVDYFDMESFINNYSPYINPRTGSTDHKKKFPISNPRHSFWDFYFPLTLKQEFPTLLLQIIK